MRMHQGGGFPDKCDGLEDSDCEDGPEHINEPALEEQVDRGEEQPGYLSVLAIRSFAKYAQHIIVVGPVLTFSTAVDLYFFICIQT